MRHKPENAMKGSPFVSPWSAQCLDGSSVPESQGCHQCLKPGRPRRLCWLPVSAGSGVPAGWDGTESLERVSLPMSPVPFVRSCWLREQARWVPLSPPLQPQCLLGTSRWPGREDRTAGSWHQRQADLSLGLASVSCCAARSQACFANEPFSLWLNCV